MADLVLEVRHLSKTFTATRALQDLTLSVASGEIVAICGQNGSGKSTLIKVLAGFHEADPGGEILLHGEPFNPRREDGRSLHFIHQDLALVHSLSTIENLALSKSHVRGLLAPNLIRREIEAAETMLARLGVSFDVTLPIAQLTQAERTMVAIVRATDGWERPDNVLVLDEPTASLHQGEAAKLFQAVQRLAAGGAGVIFVSHRLDEVLGLSDRVVVFRDGRSVADLGKNEMTQDAIVSAMVGGSVDVVAKETSTSDELVLEVSSISGPRVEEVSLAVTRGEILGISGLIGSGVETLGSLVAGGLKRDAGTVTVAGRAAPGGDVGASIALGLAYAPADRLRHGAMMDLSVEENLTLPLLRPITGIVGQIRRREERRQAEHWLQRLDVRPPDPERYMTQLSGGNQQKVVLAKWLRTSPAALWLDEPTQGVDVGAKSSIHALIVEAAREGAGVVVASTDAKELVALCHRVIVLDGGVVVAELAGRDLTEQNLVSTSGGTQMVNRGTPGGNP